ncbi:MAG: methionine--tRNA ligase [Longimicrobiales bacterium]|nr:methionine--tRNA ligase [Longimicrobiales bacterium]
MSRRRYITTPIYYASGEPHIGHAYTTILADALARFDRRRGREVRFLTGTDEHGQKIQEEATRRGVEPLELCDEMAARFRAAWDQLDIGYDRFIRTTEAEHIAIVQSFVQRLHDRGHIYEGEYAGWYSVTQERYFTEKEIGADRVDPISGKPVEWVEEANWFFRMSSFQEALVRHIEANPEWILPENRRNEVLGFLQQPLGDLSISRPRKRLRWGVPLPFAPEHVTYVWVDALINYFTASGAIAPGTPSDDPSWEDLSGSWWPADLHLLGKDILTTHTVYWPTLLLGAGLPLPRQFLAHGWWVVGDAKMSKSLGNVIDPLALSERYGADALRWYLLREMPTGQDASFTPERFDTRYDELANVLGNLASRTLGMTVRYRDGIIPDAPARGLDDAIEAACSGVENALVHYRVHEALAAAMNLARAANGYVEEREPWAQARDPERAGDLDETLATLLRALTVLCALFEPVCVRQIALLARRLGLDDVPTLADARTVDLSGRRVEKGDPLFPRI